MMKRHSLAKQTFSFELLLVGQAEISRSMADALFEAGCSDATLSACGGRVLLDFDREAATQKDAVQSAIEDVSRAGYRTELIG